MSTERVKKLTSGNRLSTGNKPSIIRLARMAGVRSISDEAVQTINTLIEKKLESTIRKIFVLNEQRGTKSLMVEDVYNTLQIIGEGFTRSDNLGTKVVGKL